MEPLTAAQRRLIEGYAARWKPAGVVRGLYPALWFAAQAAGLSPDEVEAAAWLGVIRAAQKYDPDHPRRVQFASYANIWVRSAVQLEVSRCHRKKVINATVRPDADTGHGDGLFGWGVIPDPDADDPAELGEVDWRRVRLREILADLDPRTRRVLELRYGLADGTGRTLREVGEAVGVTKERVRQVVELAVREAAAVANGSAAVRKAMARHDGHTCPACQTPYPTKYRRCYRCHPGRRKKEPAKALTGGS